MKPAAGAYAMRGLTMDEDTCPRWGTQRGEAAVVE